MIGSHVGGNATLEISANGVEFFLTNLQIIIQPMSGIVSISPTLGSLQRGLRIVVFFPSVSSVANSMFCSLDTDSSSLWGSASLQSFGRVLCSFSSCSDCPIGLHSISINVDSAVWGRKAGAFQHIPMWYVSALQPSFGQLTGGAKVTVSGANFDANSVCLFGGNSTHVVAEYTSSTLVTCVVPPKSSPGSVLVSIDVFGTSSAESVIFSYVAAAEVYSMTPSVIPAGPGSTITLKGRFFSAGVGVWCRIGPHGLNSSLEPGGTY
jgi:hypothetical protein